MTLFGSGPEKKYKSRVPPMRRYWIKDWFEDGGEARMMSEPAALDSTVRERTEDDLKRITDLDRKTPWDWKLFVDGTHRCSR
jgi:hypothetical protein